MSYRYKLDSSSKKHRCPACNKLRFVRYFDEITATFAAEQYGRCDRESKCGYHSAPPAETLCYFVTTDSIRDISAKAFLVKQGTVEMIIPKKVAFEQLPTGIFIAAYFLQDSKYKCSLKYNENEQKFFSEEGNGTAVQIPVKKVEVQQPVYFDFHTFKSTLKGYEHNTFIQNLLHRVVFPFDAADVIKIIELYRLGTVTKGYRASAITFPFIDVSGNVRTVQVKQFDEQNHTTGTDFLHSIIEKHHSRNNKPLPEWLEAYTKQDKRVSCLFGEHLLSRFPLGPVALVEAPKTAIYGTLYFGSPEIPNNLIWLAVYNKSSFSFDKVQALKGRDVFVFPDLSKDGSTFQEWQRKAKDFEARLPGTRFIFSDLLEQYATPQQRLQGADIADVLASHNPKAFRPKVVKPYEQYTYEERIKAGLQLFTIQELKALAADIFRGSETISYNDLKRYLESTGLQGNDVSDLIDVLNIQGILKAVQYPNYILT